MAEAQSVQILFDQANEAYSDGDYLQAVERYQEILRNGYESGALYFNLGNSYYKLDRIGESILYYEKAVKLIPGDEALIQNLQMARLRIVDEIEPMPRLFIEVWWEKMIHFLPLGGFAWITLLIFVLFTVFLSSYVIYHKRIFEYTVWLFSVCFIIILLLFLGRIYNLEKNEFGIIMAKKVSVVSEPSINSTEMFILHEGAKVQLTRSVNGWYEITLADGKTGWLQSDNLQKI
jgi:tetratricopeptide (TPR) repeat protein